MVDKKDVYIVLLLAFIVFSLGIFFQAKTDLFSTVTSTRTCSSWLANEGIETNVTLPYSWSYTSSQKRCITSMVDSNGGCQLTYTAGACNITSTCSESWVTGSWSTCLNGVQTRTVTDSNNCGTALSKPLTSQTCTSTTCNTAYDTNCDGKVNDSEMLSAISSWTSNSITDSQILNAISAWASS